MTTVVTVVLLALFLGLLYRGLSYFAWAGTAAVGFVVWYLSGVQSPVWFWTLLVPTAALALLFGVPALRRTLLTRRVMPLLGKLLPRMSETERAALEAGTVWWEAELFAGAPQWRRLLDFKVADLTPRERAFLDGPCEEVCRRVKDHELARINDLPAEVWQYLKEHKFFGMIIPESHGGLGFSAQAHSAVVTRLASRSATLAVTVMVPNSLGPAELILHYGTDEQKQHYLPRLARGEEIPCFALTEPTAGSDATGLRSEGVVCRGTFQGKDVLGMRLSWSKRYATLAPAATVIGLAFQLKDPEHLLGNEVDLGITCALIPTRIPGVEVGPRHDPLGVPFLNGTTTGRDVFVPLDYVIGGKAQAGKGWGMLMQCLAAGRGVSLPAMSTGAARLVTRAVGAYATVREQFHLPIGRFEGIEEPLSRIAGSTYWMDAARRLTAGAIDAGHKPSVVSAIVKRYITEAMRTVVNDAMDVMGGAAISKGPRNVLAGAYAAAPIGITVEGANILTRSMIIFGQGAIRCHPHAQKEMRAVADRDLVAFDRELFAHLGFVARNVTRTTLLALCGGRLVPPPVPGPARRWYQELSRLSAAYALLSDVAMGTLGGSLKRKEKLCGRLADALAWMYLASAALKRFHDEGAPTRDLPYLRWSCEHALWQIEQALGGFLDNFPLRWLARGLRWLVFPFGMTRKAPGDRLGGEVARGLLDDGEARRHLSAGMFVPPPDEPGMGQLEDALVRVVRAQPALLRMREAIKAGKLKADGGSLLDAAVAVGVLSTEDRKLVQDAERARMEAITVDAFRTPTTAAAPVPAAAHT